MTDIFFIKKTLQDAVQSAAASFGVEGIPVTIEIPKEKGHGDFSSPLAMILAKKLKKAPLAIAQELASKLDLPPGFASKIEVAPPGFINITLHSEVYCAALLSALEMDRDYGKNNQGRGLKLILEFVSANPTGPLNVVNARAASLGDSIANLLTASGWEVTREYYVNDAGVQARLFGESLWAALQRVQGKTAEAPEGGYQGAYMEELARELSATAEFNEKSRDLPKEKLCAWMGEWGMTRVVGWHRDAMEKYGVRFDQWYGENQSLHRTGLVDQAVQRLKDMGLTYEKEDALWIKTSEFGAPKDEVVIKGNGQPAYFAADIAYHLQKFERGFDRVLDIWGPDHHGHIQRMKSALLALKQPVDHFTVLIAQQVNLLEGGEKVKMSKREGKFVTMEELLDRVGRDAARFFFVMRSSNSPLDFDIQVAQKQTDENPVYYVQYAHARICSLLRRAAESGFAPSGDLADLKELREPEEFLLLKEILEYPQWVEESGRAYEPHRVVVYLQNLAASFHLFYGKHRILDSPKKLGDARLALAMGVKNVLRNGLGLLGVSSPESM